MVIVEWETTLFTAFAILCTSFLLTLAEWPLLSFIKITRNTSYLRQALYINLLGAGILLAFGASVMASFELFYQLNIDPYFAPPFVIQPVLGYVLWLANRSSLIIDILISFLCVLLLLIAARIIGLSRYGHFTIVSLIYVLLTTIAYLCVFFWADSWISHFAIRWGYYVPPEASFVY